MFMVEALMTLGCYDNNNLIERYTVVSLKLTCEVTLSVLKGWLTGFFLGLIVFMGCSLTCVHACFF